MLYRKPNRLKEYDYSTPAWYFVTICTQNHEHRFGKIVNGNMILSTVGIITDVCWKNIEVLHKHIELDDYVIMPNHIHGIIIINSVVDANFASTTFASTSVPSTSFASTTTDRTKMELSKLIQQFKRAITIKIKSTTNESDFKWQRSFYDRIIRNEKELFNIRKYIQQNPFKWGLGETH